MSDAPKMTEREELLKRHARAVAVVGDVPMRYIDDPDGGAFAEKPVCLKDNQVGNIVCALAEAGLLKECPGRTPPTPTKLTRAGQDEYTALANLVCDVEALLECQSFGTVAETRLTILAAISKLQAAAIAEKGAPPSHAPNCGKWDETGTWLVPTRECTCKGAPPSPLTEEGGESARSTESGVGPTGHADNCGFHLDQYWWECTCGAINCQICGTCLYGQEAGMICRNLECPKGKR